jgi:CPA1 family monovalent cation:H+ antiporter
VRHVRIPYTVALVVVGLVLGALHLVQPLHLTKELLFTLVLPGLIFEASFNLDAAEFGRNRLAMVTLAIPGVVVAMGLTAALVSFLLSVTAIDPAFDWRSGLVFGALIAATDPIVVVALFKRLHVPQRLSVLVEGESLLNDGTSVVLYTIVVAYAMGAVSTVGGMAMDFLKIVGIGVIAGGMVGWIATQVTKRIDEPVIEIMLTVIAAYGSFGLAEQFHGSGVIACVTAGMICGTYGWHHGMSQETRLAVDSFWEYVAFALNSLVFLLIGLEVQGSALLSNWRPVGIAYFGSLAARAIVVLAVALLLRLTRERLPWSWNAVLVWGGLRGALSMVLALALPADFPQRETLIQLTFGVVLISLLLQGTSISWLLERIGLGSSPPDSRLTASSFSSDRRPGSHR